MKQKAMEQCKHDELLIIEALLQLISYQPKITSQEEI